jgi:hypothetical protein
MTSAIRPEEEGSSSAIDPSPLSSSKKRLRLSNSAGGGPRLTPLRVAKWMNSQTIRTFSI